MVDKRIYNIGALLITVMLLITYIQFENVQFRVDADKTTIYTKLLDNDGEPYGRFMVSGREYNSLFDGTSKMYRSVSGVTVDTIINESTNETWIIRTTPYIRGPIVKDTYYFKGNIDDVEFFPIQHTIEVFNGSGFFYRYEVRDLFYDGPTEKLDTTSMEFGRNIKVTWNDDYRWAWVYKTGLLKVQYDIDSDYVKFENKIFDPLPVSDYIIDGDTVYINDSKIYLSAKPKIQSGSGIVYSNLISKVYDGEANIIYGFSNITRPKWAEYYNLNNQTIQYNRTCNGTFNYTLSPKYAWCWNGTELDWEHYFDSGSLATKTIFWSEEEPIGWTKFNSFEKIEHNFDNKSSWYVIKNKDLEVGKEYQLRMYLEVEGSGKYDIAIYPSSYGNDIGVAISNNHFYYLDPWYLDTDIIHYYKFDGDATDSVNLDNGTVTDATLTTGKINQGYLFDSADETNRIVLPFDNSEIAGSFTISAWAYFNNFVGGMALISADAVSRGFTIQMDGANAGTARIDFYGNYGGGTSLASSSAGSITFTGWHHVVCTYNGTIPKIYIDGSLDGSGSSTSGNVADNNVNIEIGHNSYDGSAIRWMDGIIDEVGIWGRALSSSEVSDLYNSGDGIQYPFTTDSCSCPGADTNWEIDCTDNCSIQDDCDIGTGLLNFTGAGEVHFNSSIIMANRTHPTNGCIAYLYSNSNRNVTG